MKQTVGPGLQSHHIAMLIQHLLSKSTGPQAQSNEHFRGPKEPVSTNLHENDLKWRAVLVKCTEENFSKRWDREDK